MKTNRKILFTFPKKIYPRLNRLKCLLLAIPYCYTIDCIRAQKINRTIVKITAKQHVNYIALLHMKVFNKRFI